ncbi:3-dehydroquinate synthase [Alicyclobacillus fastidiosus]|uniref:3-dehydroquinate synthase n=1 Tax=Alicyclobacillus fastidiosus TaxID=392011 RepID=A0ABV5AAU0_9BACL|nr:3-dehydroquinate synthase [Alicyclobacillus fastidiosus]WEH11847.1 3-dehydroquinate synthase [Alicyclobacillus fastidiosus]
MSILEVKSKSGSYRVVAEGNVLATLGEQLQRLHISERTNVTVITDDTVGALPFAKDALRSLAATGYRHQVLEVPAGDHSKSLATASTLYPKLLSFGMRRSDLIVALGGGVIGDLAGFVAATYLRGISFVQAPTTLLAHDSSIGGKVGVNLPEGKNLVGAFYPPRAVLYDLSALATLPARQWTNGMAEVIKHGIIGDARLFEGLEERPLVACPDADVLEPILTAAMKVKIDVVESDEKEANRRQVLNVGHTLGHAIEQRSHYGLGHGEAISIGLVLEAKLAVARGLLDEATATRIERVLAGHGLPTKTPRDDWDEVAAFIDVDKKHGRALWTFALPTAIGDVVIVDDVSPDEVKAVYDRSLEEA